MYVYMYVYIYIYICIGSRVAWPAAKRCVSDSSVPTAFSEAALREHGLFVSGDALEEEAFDRMVRRPQSAKHRVALSQRNARLNRDP